MGLGLAARLRVPFGLRLGARPASLRTKQGRTTLGETAAKHVEDGLHAVEEDLGGLGDNRVGVQLAGGAAGSLGGLGDLGGGGAVVLSNSLFNGMGTDGMRRE